MGDVLIILGSPRAGGNTAAAADVLRSGLGAERVDVLDLRTARIDPFDHELPMSRDDFPAVVSRLLDHRHLVFATPVYWYAMSGLTKTLFDRFTDLLIDAAARALGRALAGRDMWLLATGTDELLPEGFTVPFERTAEYFAMRWRSACYVQVDDQRLPAEQDFGAVAEFGAQLRSSLQS